MSDHNNQSPEDIKRRRFLTGVTVGIGALGAAAGVSPFLISMSPSERAKNAGAPVSYDFSRLEPVCTHLGCSPVEKLAIGPDEQMGEDSQGGFFCPCHGSKFDLAGRVYKSVPATSNMPVPPYKFTSESVILIGDDSGRS